MVMGTSGTPMPIKEVVAWAYTARGSTEIEPFAPDPSDGGCMRWGMCDMAWRGADESDKGSALDLFGAEPSKTE